MVSDQQTKQNPVPACTSCQYQQALIQPQELVSLAELSGIFLDRKWWLLASITCALLIGIASIMSKTPTYRADGLIQVEHKKSGFEELENITNILESDTEVSSAQEILTSRLVMEKVAFNQKLNIIAEPINFPIIGSIISRRFSGDMPNSPWLGLSSYAWGGEAIKIDSLDVPKDYLDRTLYLIAGEADTFTVTDSNGQVLLEAFVAHRATEQGFSILATQLIARPGTKFRLVKLSKEAAVNSLRKRFAVKERGKQSGILELSLTGRDADKTRRVLDEIQNTYLRLNIERHSAQAEQTLRFLDTQLHILKQQVDSAETAYNSYRQSKGSLDLNIETQGVLKSLIDIEDATLLLKQEREELRRRFTTLHPSIQALNGKLEQLAERRTDIENEISDLPDTQQTVLRLARDMKVSSKLYTSLLNVAQQLEVSKAGAIGNIRIIDHAAVSHTPVGIRPHLILAISALSGLVVGVIGILLLRITRVVIDDPDTIETELGLPVYATVPHSKAEASLSRKQKKGQQEIGVLAAITPSDETIESLRGLRATFHFALLDAKRRSLLITGSRQGLGKSFLAKNFGAVLAQLGQRIVIVDADLRRGDINVGFGLDREVGVSDYITGRAGIMDVIKTTMIHNLYVVTSGHPPPNPSELLMHIRFETLLQELRDNFDIMIVDAPPVLAVSDATIIGRHTGATLLVARAGKHPISELEQAVKRLNQSGIAVKGFIFNDIDISRQRNRYGHKGHVYNYTYK